jgi:cytochrome P450 family 142 subfamily A polypeptide 1
MTVTETRPTIDLMAGSFWGGDFHQAFTWMRANEPLFHDGRIWAATTYELLKDISKQPDLFSNAQGIRPDSGHMAMMIDFDDPEHMRRRKLVNRGFTPKRVRESQGAIRRACDEIIDGVCERGECDFVRDIAAWLPMIMIGDALGVPADRRGELLEWSDGMVTALVGSDSDETMEAATTAYLAYREFATEAIAERRAEPRDDLMSVLVHAEVDGDRLDDESIMAESLLILIGGDETTRHVITGGLYQLLANPDQRDALAADRSLMDGAVEEMLRWVSPIRNMNRTVTRDVTYAGRDLAEGDKVILVYPSANRDESVFDDPFRFDIRRSPNEHVAFGFGSHFCLGNSLARLELSVMFDTLLERLPDIELVGGEPANRPANFVSGYETMPVRFTPSPKVG